MLAFFKTAASGGEPLLTSDRCPVHRGVELVVCVRVFNDTRALARFRKSLRILAARCYGSKIVGCPVQHEDRFLHVLLIAKARIAYGVGGYVSDELEVRVTVHLLEPSHAGIERGGTALRETHNGDPRGVDPWLFGDYFECAVSVDNPRQKGDLAWIGGIIDESATGIAVNCKCGNAYFIQDSRPFLVGRAFCDG